MDAMAAAAAQVVAQQEALQQQQQQLPPLAHQQVQHLQSQVYQKLVRRGHQIELLHQAKYLCDHQDYVDLTIYCEDGVVRAHQLLLATASPFLKILFQTSPLYGIDEISLIMPEVKVCLVQALIYFVYTGTVVSREDHFYSLMKLVYALNIDASITAETTNEKPTAFGAPLMNPVDSPLKRKLPHQLVMPPLPTQPNPPGGVSLPTHPVPPAKMPRMSTSAQPQLPTQPTLQLPTQPLPVMQQQQQQPQTSTTSSKMPQIQLPTQPVPMAGVSMNGVGQIKNETVQAATAAAAAATQPSGGSYIAMDPTTGLSYKVELPNGPVSTAGGDTSDPLAAIMNETIFTETSQAQTTMYTTENGQVVYTTTTHPGLPTQPNPPEPPQQVVEPSPTKGKKGKKRQNNKENQIMAESVDDLPCAPDDDDISTPYQCENCNKTIKGRVMLQAHQYQEHYDNPALNALDIGDRHACRVCLRLFTRNSDVKAHILRVHCGDRRYPCQMCGKRFKESTHLRKHLYTHTGERPHQCVLCAKGFQTSSDLKRHRRTRVHQEREEQANGGKPVREGAEGEEEDEDDPNNTSVDTSQVTWTEDMDTSAASNASTSTANTANTAQALLNNITQPIAPAGSQQVEFSTGNGTSSSGSTIDMKALGGAGASWNNEASANQAPATSVAATTASTSASSTLDLKAIGGGTTVDMEALKSWENNGDQQDQQDTQQQQVEAALAAVTEPPQLPVAPPTTTAADVLPTPSSLEPPAATVAQPQPASQVQHLSQEPQQQHVQSMEDQHMEPVPAMPQVQQQQQPQAPPMPAPVTEAKRSSSVDSPGPDEERLTVVEGDDSSQDSVPSSTMAPPVPSQALLTPQDSAASVPVTQSEPQQQIQSLLDGDNGSGAAAPTESDAPKQDAPSIS